MINILIVSHGEMAKGSYDTIKLFFDSLVGVDYLIFNNNESPEQLYKALLKKFNEFKQSDGLIILTDISYGTPANQAKILSSNYSNVRVISGFNLGMLLEGIILQESLDIDELAQKMIDTGRMSINLYSFNNMKDSDFDKEF